MLVAGVFLSLLCVFMGLIAFGLINNSEYCMAESAS